MRLTGGHIPRIETLAFVTCKMEGVWNQSASVKRTTQAERQHRRTKNILGVRL